MSAETHAQSKIRADETQTEIKSEKQSDSSPEQIVPVIELSVPEHVLIEVYKAQWTDIHHSRNQDWELSKIIFAGVIGLSGLRFLGDHHTLQILVAVALSFISLLAVAITYRHKILFEEKMSAIRKIENHLRIDKLELFKPKESLLPPYFNTQNLLIAIYSIAFVVFAVFSGIEIF